MAAMWKPTGLHMNVGRLLRVEDQRLTIKCVDSKELTLVAGQNPARIAADYGSYRVIPPSSSEAFLLRKGTEHRIELWGGPGVLTKKSASFHLAIDVKQRNIPIALIGGSGGSMSQIAC